MEVKTDDEVLKDYCESFNLDDYGLTDVEYKEAMIFTKKSFGFQAYILGVRIDELGATIIESLPMEIKKLLGIKESNK